MGGVFSKSGGGGGEESRARNLAYTAELSSYEAACALDPDLQSFDANLQVRTNRVVNSLALGVEARSLSFDSLREVTGCLLEMNQDVVRILLESKKDIWGDQQLFDLVKDYFENSLLSLDFCTALEKCLKRARDRQLILQLAIQRFEDDQDESNNKCSRTMEQLRNFKAAQDPFSEDFFQLFQEVYKQQRLMLDKLLARRQKMDKKIKSVTTWRRVSSIIFGTAFAALLICAVVAAAVAAPPLAAALATASSVPVGSMGKWFDSLWTKHETALKAQREVIGSMHLGTCLVIKDLDNIRVLVDRVENEMESLMDNVNFSLRDKDTLNFGMEEIKKNLGAFMKSIQDLSEHADTCSRDIRRARTVVLRRIMKHPTSK